MDVLLAFLGFAFVAGVRGAPGTPAPRRHVLLALSLIVSVALLSHRVA